MEIGDEVGSLKLEFFVNRVDFDVPRLRIDEQHLIDVDGEHQFMRLRAAEVDVQGRAAIDNVRPRDFEARVRNDRQRARSIDGEAAGRGVKDRVVERQRPPSLLPLISRCVNCVPGASPWNLT